MPTPLLNHPVGKPFIELYEVESTNNYAMACIRQGLATPGQAYFAYNQTAGKGQRGRTWETVAGKNMLLSVVLNTNGLLVSHQFYTVAAVALAAYSLFSKYAGAETKVKWPNDIYWRDRKAAGILIENIVRGQECQWTVAGIGMNINQTNFDSSLINPVSLTNVTGKNFDPVLLAKELCAGIEARFTQLCQGHFSSILKEYNAVLYKANEEVMLKKDNRAFSCIVKEVNSFGQLAVKGAVKDCFEWGEVEWLMG